MSALEPGDTIRITKADDQGSHWSVPRYLDAEWNGEAFLGCERTYEDGAWSPTPWRASS